MLINKTIFKVIIIGEGGVGKTSLVKRCVDEYFKEDMKMTIGVDLSVKKITSDGEDKYLQIWDLGGQPHFKAVADVYFRGSHGAMAVFDVTRRASMDRLTDWIERVQSILGVLPMVVVGNKTDLRDPKAGDSSILKKEGQEFASKYKSPYLETSAKDNSGVAEAFQTLTDMLKPKARAT
jgi:small GTP-binding protein